MASLESDDQNVSPPAASPAVCAYPFTIFLEISHALEERKAVPNITVSLTI
jgi:hypothetical protein